MSLQIRWVHGLILPILVVIVFIYLLCIVRRIADNDEHIRCLLSLNPFRVSHA